MTYTLWELMAFFFIYSFMGWCTSVAALAVKDRKFRNRGFLNLPLCVTYGFTMDVLLVIFPELIHNFISHWIACVVVISVTEYLAGEFTKRRFGKPLWHYENQNIFAGRRSGLFRALILGTLAMGVIYLIHPVVYLMLQFIPVLVLKIVCLVLLISMCLDYVSVRYAIYRRKRGKYLELAGAEISEGKVKIGERINRSIWRRIEKAYPNMEIDNPESENDYVFAKGICMDKLIWVFLICALLGDIIETFYVRAVSGIWMSRSSVLYGPFSIVWGAGAALLTVVLQRLADREDRYIFLGGFFLGGTYEYMCSVFTEVVFGTVFWDYSDMPFNIGGRTNLLFCLFWGILSLVWVKLCYPKISSVIERIPPIAGKIATWVVLLLMGCDMIISAMAMVRYIERKTEPAPTNVIESFCDYNYPDELIEFTWPNMRIH